MRKCRRLLADFNKSKTSVSFSDIVLPRTLICTYINNGLQKSLLKLKILKKYDKTRDEVFSTIPLQTIACSLELNIQNQTSLVPPARKQKFSSFFLRQHHARFCITKEDNLTPTPKGKIFPPFWKRISRPHIELPVPTVNALYGFYYLLHAPIDGLLKMGLKVERSSSLQFISLNLLRTKRNENWTL